MLLHGPVAGGHDTLIGDKVNYGTLASSGIQ